MSLSAGAPDPDLKSGAYDRDVQLASVYARLPERDDSRLPQPQAEVIVNLTAPFPSWRWFKLQLLGINWATVALMIAILSVSSSINKQLDEQRAQALDSQAKYDKLHELMKQAAPVADKLTALHDELQAYNVSLNDAKALALANLTVHLVATQTSVKNLSVEVNHLRADMVARTSFFGFQVTGSTTMQPDPTAGGYGLTYQQVDVDTTGASWTAQYQTFTAPVAGVWRFQAPGMVAVATGSDLGPFGLLFARSGSSCVPVLRRSEMYFAPNAFAPDPVTTPVLSIVLKMQVGETIAVCGWATVPTASGTGLVTFGYQNGDRPPYGERMTFSGELLR